MGTLAARYWLVVVLAVHAWARGQILPVEVVTGHRNYFSQQSFYKSFNNRIGFFHTGSQLMVYGSQRRSELMSQEYLMLVLVNGLKVGLGSFYGTSPGLKPSLCMQYMRQIKDCHVVVAPRVDLTRSPSYDLMTQIEWRPVAGRHLRFYFRLQTMFNFRALVHNRSYQYTRMGFEMKGLQLGLSFNRDVFGADYMSKYNHGLFVRFNLL